LEAGRPRLALNSAHFGAAGYYRLSAPTEGLIGMACTGASSIQVVPTFGSEAKLGTDSWSFAAATIDPRPFLLDMATTKRLARELQLSGLQPGVMVSILGSCLSSATLITDPDAHEEASRGER
jgi:hypothetical protein